ncbi:MAG TPA: hypothetical protein VF070_34450 [Streptosporangiaceae bacterium]
MLSRQVNRVSAMAAAAMRSTSATGADGPFITAFRATTSVPAPQSK